MVLKLLPSQVQKVRDLARSSCCNCDGSACLLLEGGQETCVQLLSESGVICKYFKDAVLPGDKKLYAEIIRQNPSIEKEVK